MFFLVKFLQDSLYYVCSKSSIQKSRSGVKVKYQQCFYEAKIMCKNSNRFFLEDVCKRLNYNDLIIDVSKNNVLMNKVNLETSIMSLTNIIIEVPPTKNCIEYEVVDNVSFDFVNVDDGTEGLEIDHLRETSISEETVLNECDNNVNINQICYMQPCEVPCDKSKKTDGMDTSTNYSESDNICETNLIDGGANHIEVVEEQLHSKDIIRVDNRKMEVSFSKSHCKRYYCIYCNKLITNYGRHLLYAHKDRKEIADILTFPKGHPERHRKIAEVRKISQFKYNTDSNVNTGTIIVKRRPSKNKMRTASHYIPCSNCKEMYSKLSIRAHVAKCNPNSRMQGERNVLLQSKRFQINVNQKANTCLARDILSRCRDDQITSLILFDDLCILYGNKLTKKYRGEHDSNMIRTRLREIGRFIDEFRKINPNVKDLREILDPNHYDNIVQAINRVAGLDEDSGKYKAPSTAYNLGLHLKSIALLLETEYIKEKNAEKRENVRDLLCLIREGFKTDINRTVSENQTEHKRHKKVTLPTEEDITALKNYLKNGCKEAYESLKEKFSRRDWRNLAGRTLILLQLFNRRRAGELERILIDDFKAHEFVDDKDQVFKGLNDNEKCVARYYARFFIRGKLNRPVPVILGKEYIKYIDMILKYRTDYGVPTRNPYVFGTPGKTHNTYFRACVLMRNYSVACGAPNPDTLRGTELRKQIATACALYNLSDPLVEDMANHLGHHIDIHKKIYRQSTAREVPTIAQILLRALGEQEEDDSGNKITYLSKNLTVDSDDDMPEESHLNTPTPSNISGLPEYRKQERKSWTTPEKRAVRDEFDYLIESGIVPTYEECVQLSEKNDCLKNRTPPQIKSFVANESKKMQSPTIKEKGKRTWSTPERHVVRQNFKEYLDKKYLPSLAKRKEVIAANPELKLRNAPMLKAYINNLNKKNIKDNSGAS